MPCGQKSLFRPGAETSTQGRVRSPESRSGAFQVADVYNGGQRSPLLEEKREAQLTRE
jgi:hypothetical protein